MFSASLMLLLTFIPGYYKSPFRVVALEDQHQIAFGTCVGNRYEYLTGTTPRLLNQIIYLTQSNRCVLTLLRANCFSIFYYIWYQIKNPQRTERT